MTRPKWMRKRSRAMEYLNRLMQRTLRLGYISMTSDTDQRHFKIIFFNDDGKLDEEKFSKYFGIVIGTIKSVYREAGLNKDRDRKNKKLIDDDVNEIVGTTLWLVYKNWEDYGYEITL